MTIAEIQKECGAVLKRGGLILYPTDTVWGIGCDATNAEAIDRVYALKKRADNKALITLVCDFTMLRQFIEEVPQVAYDVLNFAVKPTTIIYDDPIRVATNLIASDNTLAVRVIKEPFCNKIIKKFRKPIVSTSANVSGQPTPRSFAEISEEIKNGVDFIVPIEQNAKKVGKPSVIIKISNSGNVKVIRE